MGVDTFLFLPEQGRIAQLTPEGRQFLWTRTRIQLTAVGLWRPNDIGVDRWWRLVGRQTP